MKIDFTRRLPVTKDEPLRLELESFFRLRPKSRGAARDGRQALAALQVAHGILDKIEEHARLVGKGLGA